MKICFVHEEYPLETNFGGIATYQKIMASYYASQGDLVTVIARGNEDACYYEDGVKVKDKVNEFIKKSNLFTKTKKVKNLCAYLGIDYHSNDIYFTEVIDNSVLFRWGKESIDYAGNTHKIEEIEKYIDEYK